MPPVAAIAGSAIIGAGASIISGNKAASAQKEAAAQAAQASKDATDQQVAEARRQYDQTRSDYAPYRDTGYKALDQLASLYGVGSKTVDPTAALEATPGYQWQLSQGLKGIDKSLASRGLLNSGGADKSRMQYAQGLASSAYNQYSSQLANLAGIGQSATNSTTAANQQSSGTISNAYAQNGQNLANIYTNAGNATASSYANTGAAISGATNNLASMYLLQKGGFFNRVGK